MGDFIVYIGIFIFVGVLVAFELSQRGRVPRFFAADDDWQIKNYGFSYSQIGRILVHYYKYDKEMLSLFSTNEYESKYSYLGGLTYITINDFLCIKGYPTKGGQFDFGVVDKETKKWRLVKYNKLTVEQGNDMILFWNHVLEVDQRIKTNKKRK